MRRRADDPVEVSLAAGELLGRLGYVDLAMEKHLLPAVQGLIERGEYIPAKGVLVPLLEARPDSAEAIRLMEEAKRKLS